MMGERLHALRDQYPGILGVRGRGMIMGVECRPAELASAISEESFKRGLIIETSGSAGQVVKFLPALTTETELLERGLDIFEEALGAALERFPQYEEQLVIAKSKSDAKAQA